MGQHLMAVANVLIPIFAGFCLVRELIGELSVQAIAFLLGCFGTFIGLVTQHQLAGKNCGLTGKLLLASGLILNCLLILFALFSEPGGWQLVAMNGSAVGCLISL